MSKAFEIMAAHLKKGDHQAIGKGAWETLLGRGWHPQQITAVAPHMGMKVGGWVQNEMGNYPNATTNVGQSGLYNIGAAQRWVNKGDSPEQIAAAGSTFANTPRGRNTNRSGWEAGFTADAAEWLKNYYSAQQEEEESDPMMDLMREQIANIPTAAELMANMPEPKIRAGKDYATTGRSAQGMRIKKGTKFAEGGKRGTKGYFGRGAKFTGDTTPTMNIKGGGGGSGSQASNTLNTA